MNRIKLRLAKARHRTTKFLVNTVARWHTASINNLARQYD